MDNKTNIAIKIKNIILIFTFSLSSLSIICSISFSLLHKTIFLYSTLLLIIGLAGIFYSYLYKKRKNKYTFIFMCLFFAFYCIFVLFLCLNYYVSSINYSQENKSIGVILGTATNNSMPSPLLKQRLDLGLENFPDRENSLFVVSGTKTEADVMESYLLNKNIDKKNILKDEKAFDTYTNMKNTYELIKNYDLNGDITIFTNDFHCLRTTFYANKVIDRSFKVVCSKSDFDIFVVFSLREFFAFIKAFIVTSI